MRPDVDPYIQKGMNKKPFVHPLLDSLIPADLRLRPLLGAFRTSGAVPSGLFSHPLVGILRFEMGARSDSNRRHSEPQSDALTN